MKKTTRTKTQVALAVMVVALAAAVGLNMKYSAEQENNTSSKYLGQVEYVDASVTDQSASTPESDYFKELRDERNASRDEALDILEETLNRTDLSEEERKSAVDKTAELASAAEKEAAIETVLKAKGFANVVAVIGEKDINIIIDKELDVAMQAQIQDAVFAQTDFTSAEIKIISAN